MNGLDVNSAPAIRLGLFLTVFVLLAVLEYLAPRRRLLYSKSRRWTCNFGISFLNAVVVSVFLPLVGIGAAVLAGERGWGLFNLLGISSWLSIPIYLLVFDLTIYWQHRLFHAIKPLWRLHRVHHTDVDYDVSTGNRFHPLSIVISSLIKLALILALGPVAIAVLISEILLNVTSMFNHSNLKLPDSLDKRLRLLVVTPDMHRVHHSTNSTEHNRNFGFNFPWWDRLFGTYQPQPALGHEAMHIGIWGYQDHHSIEILPLLVQPFTNDEEKMGSD